MLTVPVAGVQRRCADDRQRLQAAAFEKLAGHVGDIAIKKAVMPVLGHVDDTRRRVKGAGFVFEASHGLYRHGLDQALCSCGNLENVAMVARPNSSIASSLPVARVLEAFLAG